MMYGREALLSVALDCSEDICGCASVVLTGGDGIARGQNGTKTRLIIV
jgi:hypothetical protein